MPAGGSSAVGSGSNSWALKSPAMTWGVEASINRTRGKAKSVRCISLRVTVAMSSHNSSISSAGVVETGAQTPDTSHTFARQVCCSSGSRGSARVTTRPEVERCLGAPSECQAALQVGFNRTPALPVCIRLGLQASRDCISQH